MEDRCSVCGQRLTDGPHDHGPWIGRRPADEPDAGAEASTPFGEGSRDRNRRWLKVGGGLVAAWILVVLVGRLAAPSEVADAPVPTPEPEPTATAVAMATAVPGTEPTAVPELEVEVPAEDVDVGQLGSRQGADVQVERLVRQLGRRDSDAILAYRAMEGIVLIDLATGTASVVEPSTSDAEVYPQYVVLRTGGEVYPIELSVDDVLLRSNGETFAIDRLTLEARVIARDGSLIVSSSRSGSMFWVPGQDLQGSAPEVISLTGGVAEWFRSPQTAQLSVADGLGLYGVDRAPGGGTLLAGADGFEPLSDHRVLVGNGAGILEAVCVQPDICELQVTMDDGDVWAVPAGFAELGDRFLLAPNARAVLRYTPQGHAEVYDVDGQSAAWVTGASMRDAAWGPSSRFVAWVDVLGAPELRVMFIDERDWLSINLAELGVPRPMGPEVVVFSQSGADTEPGSS